MKRRDEIIWNNISRLTKEKGWSLTKLAKEAGTNTSALNNIKSGVRGIGNDLLKKFADAFKVDQAVLLSEPITSPTKEGKTVSEGTSREIMLLFETMRDAMKEQSKRLDDQTRHIEDAVKVITRYKNELQTIQESNASLNQAIDSINETLIRIKGRMADAARSGRVEDLGGVAVND